MPYSTAFDQKVYGSKTSSFHVKQLSFTTLKEFIKFAPLFLLNNCQIVSAYDRAVIFDSNGCQLSWYLEAMLNGVLNN